MGINSHLFVSLNILLKCDCWITGAKQGLCTVTTGNKKTSVRCSLKGKVHPKMKIQSLSAHSGAERKSDEISQCTKHFWIFTEKQRCSILLNNWKRCRLVLLCHKKTTKTKRCNPSLRKPWDHKLLWKEIIHTLAVELVHPSQTEWTLTVLITNYSEDFSFWKDVNNISLHLKTRPHLLQLLRRMLKRCFKMKCFVDYETSSDLPWAWGWVGDDWIIIAGWTYPLKKGPWVYST